MFMRILWFLGSIFRNKKVIEFDKGTIDLKGNGLFANGVEWDSLNPSLLGQIAGQLAILYTVVPEAIGVAWPDDVIHSPLRFPP